MSATAEQSIGIVDLNALRVNQVFIVGLVGTGFIIGGTIGGLLVALISVSLAIGLVSPDNGPFKLIYRKVLLPSGLVKRQLEPGVPAQHRFAQLLGAMVSGLAAVLILTGFSTLGWFFAGLVAALALVNLLFGFCLGCFLHLQIGRFRGTGVAT